MITYIEELMPDEQEELQRVIQMLFHQTFILERKFDRRVNRMVYNKDFRIANKHLEFLRDYFAAAGITVYENSHMGAIYIQGEQVMGEKLPRLTTIYLLVLKLLFDEKMQTVSTSNHAIVTLGEISGKVGEFGLLKSLSSVTEIRRTIALLKRYQIIEPLDVLEELSDQTRIMVYPCVNAVLVGDDIRALLSTFSDDGEELESTSEKLLSEEIETQEAEQEETLDE